MLLGTFFRLLKLNTMVKELWKSDDKKDTHSTEYMEITIKYIQCARAVLLCMHIYHQLYHQKRNQRKLEKQLLADIEQIENMEVVNFELFSHKRSSLEELRGKRIQGQMIRSRIQCLNEHEKLSNFFFNLENKTILDKTIKSKNPGWSIYQ